MLNDAQQMQALRRARSRSPSLMSSIRILVKNLHLALVLNVLLYRIVNKHSLLITLRHPPVLID